MLLLCFILRAARVNLVNRLTTSMAIKLRLRRTKLDWNVILLMPGLDWRMLSRVRLNLTNKANFFKDLLLMLTPDLMKWQEPLMKLNLLRSVCRLKTRISIDRLKNLKMLLQMQTRTSALSPLSLRILKLLQMLKQRTELHFLPSTRTCQLILKTSEKRLRMSICASLML